MLPDEENSLQQNPYDPYASYASYLRNPQTALPSPQSSPITNYAQQNAQTGQASDNEIANQSPLKSIPPQMYGTGGGGQNGSSGGQGGSALGTLGSLAATALPFLLKKGAVVTHPMIAKIGESGPEAVIPLTPRAGNRMQPDVLEGHVTSPKVPGVKYSRYTSYNRLGPHQGGQIA